jgi:hypothetical protein
MCNVQYEILRSQRYHQLAHEVYWEADAQGREHKAAKRVTSRPCPNLVSLTPSWGRGRGEEGRKQCEREELKMGSLKRRAQDRDWLWKRPVRDAFLNSLTEAQGSMCLRQRRRMCVLATRRSMCLRLSISSHKPHTSSLSLSIKICVYGSLTIHKDMRIRYMYNESRRRTVWMPRGSKFSMLQTVMQLPHASLTTSYSTSFQPRSDFSTRT